jgi:hypothetical protein
MRDGGLERTGAACAPESGVLVPDDRLPVVSSAKTLLLRCLRAERL